MRAIGYTRVSTDDQSLGLEGQERELRIWATRKGYELEQVFSDEDIGGATPIEKRPGLTAALSTLRRGSILIATKRDRFARDPDIMSVLLALVKQARAKLATMDGADTGDRAADELMGGILDMFARFERRRIGARTSAALRTKIAKGEAAGGVVPYGWRTVVDPTRIHPKKKNPIRLLVEDEQEQLALAFARELQTAGVPLRGIVAELQASGFPPRGRRWHLTSVARMLKEHTRGGLCTA